MDLRSEIEARKSRIAELKRQRESRVFVASRPSLTVVVPDEPVVNISHGAQLSKPFLYTKCTQTDALQLEPNEAPAVQIAPPTKLENSFHVVECTTLSPSLSTFVDNAWRAISRSRDRSPAFRTYTRNSAPSDESLPSCRALLSVGGARSATWTSQNDLVVCRSVDPRLASIFSLTAPEQPEYMLRSPTTISTPFVCHSRYVYAGGANGQVLAWELGMKRVGVLPQLKSAIDVSRIVALAMSATSLVSLNEDGVLCVWQSDRLARPQHRLVLEELLRTTLTTWRVGALVPTAMALCTPQDYSYGAGFGTGVCVIGLITGHLVRLPQSQSVQAQPGVVRSGSASWSHEAAIASLAFRNLPYIRTDDSQRFCVLLSAGLDWKLGIWLVPEDEGDVLELVNIGVDFSVHSVAWHPQWPSVFAAAGESQCQVWDLGTSRVRPYAVFKSSGDIIDVQFSPTHATLLTVCTADSATVCAFADPQNEKDFI